MKREVPGGTSGLLSAIEENNWCGFSPSSCQERVWTWRDISRSAVFWPRRQLVPEWHEHTLWWQFPCHCSDHMNEITKINEQCEWRYLTCIAQGGMCSVQSWCSCTVVRIGGAFLWDGILWPFEPAWVWRGRHSWCKGDSWGRKTVFWLARPALPSLGRSSPWSTAALSEVCY